MKAIGKCEVCEGKIIQAGNGNIFCETCSDKNFEKCLQLLADRRRKITEINNQSSSTLDEVEPK